MNQHLNKGQNKPTWDAVPAKVKAEVESVLGTRVANAIQAWGGYGPSATFVLELENGERVFFKGVYPQANGFMKRNQESEIRAYTGLPEIGPWSPRFRGIVEVEDWRVILLEAVVGGERPPPWTPRLAGAAVRAMADMHSAFVGKPLPAWLPPAFEFWSERANWGTFLKDGRAVEGLGLPEPSWVREMRVR